jgi:hypothetical protein
MATYQLTFPMKAKRAPELIEADYVWIKEGAAVFRKGTDVVLILSTHAFDEIRNLSVEHIAAPPVVLR